MLLDYASLKAMAKSIGRPVVSLMALAPTNDPFYAGAPARVRDGEWFAALWADHGGAGTHLRRFHYRLISQSTSIKMPDGRDYENTQHCWQYMNSASKAARYLSLIGVDDIIDQRNDEPMIFVAHNQRDEDSQVSCEARCEWADVEVPDMPLLPFLSVDGLSEVTDAIQDYIVEVWVEKSTQNDWLVPLCRRRGVNLVVGIGEQSEVRSRELAMRAAKYGTPVRVFYLSDFDPGGRSMPKAVARKVEFTIAKHDLNLDIQVIPLALTPEQCIAYNLPRTPIKETERRRDKFQSIFGVGATELDAMEAIHPGVLAQLLDDEISKFLDRDLKRRVREAFSETSLQLDVLERRILRRHAEDINKVSEDFEAIRELIREWEEDASDLWQTIHAEMDAERPDLSHIQVPRSQAPGRTDRFVLFDSRRDYFTQMDSYNAWRDGAECADDGDAA